MNQNNVFFYFLKIIFDISTSKRSENIKKKIKQKKIQNLVERRLNRVPKRDLREMQQSELLLLSKT
jgi:hypothetical protein